MSLKWKKFNALGTEIIITADLPPGREAIFEEAEKITRDFESRFSRFLPGNELAKFNDSSAGETPVSPMMAELLKLAKDMYSLTGGVFDPTVIGSLEKIGYAKNFTEIAADNAVKADAKKIREEFLVRPKMDELKISGDTAVKPEGFRLDLGGLGKGFLADHLSTRLFSEVSDFWISAGGDLSVKGREPGDDGWKIGVSNPHQSDREIFHLKNRGEKIGVATSGIFKRKGDSGGFAWHHLIDPRTGLPAENEILAVTAVSGDAVRADVFAKTVLILGEQEGLEFIDKQDGSAALIFLKNGGVVFSKNALVYF